MRAQRAFSCLAALICAAVLLFQASTISASEGERPVTRDYALVTAPPAPVRQTVDEALAKTEGCQSCHVATEAPTMHVSPAVRLGCTDCHGGNAAIRGNPELPRDDPAYAAARDAAHVLPRYPGGWHFPSSANPKHSYTLLNREAPEFVRFVNPSDYRVARAACGACHLPTIEAAERSLMASGAMLWGGAAYNNGIVPLKNYIFGEAYTESGQPASSSPLALPRSISSAASSSTPASRAAMIRARSRVLIRLLPLTGAKCQPGSFSGSTSPPPRIANTCVAPKARAAASSAIRQSSGSTAARSRSLSLQPGRSGKMLSIPAPSSRRITSTVNRRIRLDSSNKAGATSTRRLRCRSNTRASSLAAAPPGRGQG